MMPAAQQSLWATSTVCIWDTPRCCALPMQPGPMRHWRCDLRATSARGIPPDDPPFRLTLSAERADALAALGCTLLYELRSIRCSA